MWSFLLALYTLVLLALLPTFTAGNGGGNSAYYDKSFTLFSDSGDLLQVKYARLAGLQGQTVLCAGIPRIPSSSNEAVDEVLVCMPSQKVTQVLLDRRSVDKLSRVDDHIYVLFSGLAGDGRALIRAIREFCIRFRSSFGMGPSVLGVAQEIANFQYEATTAGGKRPYGVQILVVGYDEDSATMEIYRTEPSGEIAKFRAIAIGKHSDNLNIRLERDWPTVCEEQGFIEGSSGRRRVSRLFSRLLNLAHPDNKKEGQDGEVAQKPPGDAGNEEGDEDTTADFYTLTFDRKTKKLVKEYISSDDL